MTSFTTAIENMDWTAIADQLDADGYALLPERLASTQARTLAQQMMELSPVSLASRGLGRGDLFSFGTELPVPLTQWRAAIYQHLVPVANRWSERLKTGYSYPAQLDDFLQRNRQAGQTTPLSRLICLEEQDYLALHRHNQGVHRFPLQLMVLLSAPGDEFTGGELVMTEQRPRMQSRPMVLPLRFGEVAIISTADRPVEGGRGYYRVNVRHAISRVRSGRRIGLELSFHDAPSA